MTTTAIRARGLKKYFGEKAALAGMDLEIEKGKIHALLGPNGAGKTTFIKLAATLLKPSGGCLEVMGADTVKDAAKVKQLISLTGQNASVDEELTGYENLYLFSRLLGLSSEDARRRSLELLDFFSLNEAKKRLVKNYSGGMRRRLDIAASIIKTPEILFLDEPTTGLDPRSRKALWDVVREIANSGTTVVLTTQYLEEADQLADKIAVIDRGTLISHGTGDELKTSVGKNILHFSLDGCKPASRESVCKILDTGKNGVQRVRFTGNSFSTAVNDISQSLRVLSVLQEQGHVVTSYSLSRPNLDEVFLALTGDHKPGSHNTEEKGPSGETTGGVKAEGILSNDQLHRHGSVIKDSIMFGWRCLLKVKHIPEQFIDVLITPAMFTFMFSFLLGGALAGSTKDYLTFLVPGMLVQTLAFNSVYSGLTINTDIAKGIFDRFKSMPIWPTSPFIGLFIGDCLRHIISCVFLLLFASLIGYRFQTSAPYIIVALLIVILFSLSLSWFFIILGLVMRSLSAVMSTSWLILMPLVFMSNIYADPVTMPPWLQTFIAFNPVSWQVNTVRALFSGIFEPSLIAQSLLASILMTLLVAPVAVVLYSREG